MWNFSIATCSTKGPSSEKPISPTKSYYLATERARSLESPSFPTSPTNPKNPSSPSSISTSVAKSQKSKSACTRNLFPQCPICPKSSAGIIPSPWSCQNYLPTRIPTMFLKPTTRQTISYHTTVKSDLLTKD